MSKGKSPLPPFFKGGRNLTPWSPRWSLQFPPFSRSGESRAPWSPRWSLRFSPFEKGGHRGICLSLFIALSLASSAAIAQAVADPAPLQFHDRAQERRFHALVSELRCVKCQNQSLADSNAQIAHDLRREVLELMQQGRSDDEIKRFLVARYGEFVLYRPRVEAATWLLWFGPALLLLAGGAVIVAIVRRRGRGAVPPDDAQEW